MLSIGYLLSGRVAAIAGVSGHRDSERKKEKCSGKNQKEAAELENPKGSHGPAAWEQKLVWIKIFPGGVMLA